MEITNLNSQLEKMDYSQIQKYLNEQSIKYLYIIQKEYGEYMNPLRQKFMRKLLISENVIVEENGNKYIENQKQCIQESKNLTLLEKQEAISKITIPSGHGGKVFQDEKIHFYPSKLLSVNPNLSENELKQSLEKVLIHELLHYFIRPKYLDIMNKPELKEINSFTAEGLVDMCARDLQNKYGLFPNYNSNYSSNVLFVREALASIPTTAERMKLFFNGSIEKIYQKTSTQTYNSQEKFIKARDKKTKYDKLISNISRICYSNPSHMESCQRFLYNFSANFKSKKEALNAIDTMSQKQFSDKQPMIQKQIISYKEPQQINIIPKIVEKKPFDQRSTTEIQIAQQIREKNKAISQKKLQNKSKSLTKQLPNSSSINKGYIDVTILLLMISCITLILSKMVYFVIK